jgi:cytosine/uracil/thiamine/allantoin permease
VVESVPAFFESLYTYAWFAGLFISGGLHYGLTMMLGSQRAGDVTPAETSS